MTGVDHLASETVSLYSLNLLLKLPPLSKPSQTRHIHITDLSINHVSSSRSMSTPRLSILP